MAAAHALHPGRVFAQLPLTRFDLDVERTGGEVRVSGDGRGSLDLAPVRRFWTRWFDRGPWPVEDLYYGLVGRFVDRVVVEDPAAYAALRGRSVLYLANHQTGVESLLFSIVASALNEVPTVTLAKVEHRDTWLGRLIAHAFSYPGVTDPRVMTFFDREDKASLVRVIGELAAEMTGPGRSVMVHVEGTRSLSCRTPVEKMSGAFIDMALQVGAPVVPVRFVGGLPADPLETRLEFPLGMGRQEIHLGTPADARAPGGAFTTARARSWSSRRSTASGSRTPWSSPSRGDPDFAKTRARLAGRARRLARARDAPRGPRAAERRPATRSGGSSRPRPPPPSPGTRPRRGGGSWRWAGGCWAAPASPSPPAPRAG